MFVIIETMFQNNSTSTDTHSPQEILPPILIGTWAWGDKLLWGYGKNYGDEDLQGAFLSCIDHGMTGFDTSEVYGQGVSENLIGQFKQTAEAKLFIASKFMPYPWRLTRNSLRRALKNSLERLNIEILDLYQLQAPLPPRNIESWMDALAMMVQEGLIRRIGICGVNQEQLQKAVTALASTGNHLFSCQIEYNWLNRSVEKENLVRVCKQSGIHVFASSPLAQGLLTGKYSPDHPPAGLRGTRYSNAVLEKIANAQLSIRKVLNNHPGATAAQVAVNWLRARGITPVVGVKTAEQVEDIALSLEWDLSDAEVDYLDNLSTILFG